MKKFFVFALAILLVFAFTLPAAAVEHVFGGYWRTRFGTQQNFTGEDSTEVRDVSLVDQRTRLYYTAVLHDNLKLVNKFEMDAVWGLNGAQGGGTVAGTNADADIGADGVGVELKNSYADFNLGDWNFKVGIQGVKLARGLVADCDAAGVVATYHGDNFQLPLFWVKGFEGSGEGIINDNEKDVDFYGTAPIFNINDVSINPFFVWATSEDASSWAPATNANDVNAFATASHVKDVDLYYAGVNLDYKADNFSVWGTFVYESGEVELPTDGAVVWGFSGPTSPYSLDVDAYLIAGGGSVDLNEIELHGQVVYATGDSTKDQEIDSFFVPGGVQSYYWAEIMGLGAMDNQASVNAPGDKPSNLIMFNVGTTFSPMDKLTVKLDLWNANKEEDDTFGEDHLGTEIDVLLSYQLLEGLNADFIAAYLFRGDATYRETAATSNEADPWEMAFRLSLSF